jgi:sugar fermentation stimulation protein A
MDYPLKLEPAIYLARINRFLGVVNYEGEKKLYFIPNPGRMHELLVPGKIVYILKKREPNRKTLYDMVLVSYRDILVSIDSRLPNKLLVEAINRSQLPEFHGFNVEKTEPFFGDSRLDILLSNGEVSLLVEAKSCTLVEKGIALFPDAPTKRGVRHLRTLIEAQGQSRSAIIFVVQRSDANLFQPNKSTDPVFSEALSDAVCAGVEIYAYRSRVSTSSINIEGLIPVRIW